MPSPGTPATMHGGHASAQRLPQECAAADQTRDPHSARPSCGHAVSSCRRAPAASARAAAPILKIVANEPIAQLSIDARTIVVPEATRTMEVPFSGEPPERLIALTEDGRKLEITLTQTQRDIRLDFPAQTSASPAKPAPIRPGSRPSRRAQPEDGLADSPYGAQ